MKQDHNAEWKPAIGDFIVTTEDTKITPDGYNDGGSHWVGGLTHTVKANTRFVVKRFDAFTFQYVIIGGDCKSYTCSRSYIRHYFRAMSVVERLAAEV
jgi:hypothetical protein